MGDSVDLALQQLFEHEALAHATEADTTSGNAWTIYLDLDEFFPENGYAELYGELGSIDSVAELLGGRSDRQLAYFLIDSDAGPVNWDWRLGSFRIGDRGYLYLWKLPDVGLGYPVLGVWEPYDDEAACTACFVAAYRANAELISIADQLLLTEPVTEKVMTEALWLAIQDGPQHIGPSSTERMGLGDSGTSEVTREQVRQFVVDSMRRLR